jgi:excisionase family DNA binding protein
MAVNGNDYVTLINAADTANVPAGTLRQWIENGRLPATTSDRGRLVRLADVWRLIEPDQVAAATTSVVDGITPADAQPPPGPVAPVLATTSRRRVVARIGAAYIDKLDELYRAQIAAKSGEIATKDELIVELRRRAERAEQQVAAMEQQLVEAQTPAIVDQASSTDNAPARPPAPPSSSLLERLLLWSRQR